MRKFVCVIAAVCLTVSLARAEEAPLPVLTVKPTGDSIYALGVEVSMDPKPDLKSARGAVNAWIALLNETDASAKSKAEHQARVNKLSTAALEELEAVLFSADAAKAQISRRANPEKRESPYQSSREYPVIIEETPEEDGSVTIVVSIKTESRYKPADGDWQTTRGEDRERYSLVKGADENWRINTMEQGRRDEKASKPDAPVFNWSALRDFRREVAIEFADAEKNKLVKPEFKQATPEEAAMSFVTGLRTFQEKLAWHPMIVSCKAVTAFSDDWFSAKYTDQVAREVEQRLERPKKADAAPEVEGLRDETEKSATVVFKFSDSKARDKLVVKVVKVGDQWRVSEAGDLRNAGTEKETYEAKADIYRRW